MDGWMDGWMDGRMDGWMDGWTDGILRWVNLAKSIRFLSRQLPFFLAMRFSQ